MRTYPRTARRRLPAAIALLVLSVGPLAAQQRKYLIELGAAGAYLSYDSATELDPAFGGVGRLGLWLPANFSVELAGTFAKPKTTVTTTSETVNARTFSGSLLYNILIGSKNSFYLKAGAGSTKYGGDCTGVRTICGTGGSLLGGLGLRVGLAPTVMIRGEAEVTSNKSSTQNFTNVGGSLGLSLMLGSKPIPDTDGDRIQDNRDRCPDTPRGAQVDDRGCPSDEDSDGVFNGIDRCPGSVAGATVDETGCPKDSDADNIPDGIDRCPDTPPGVLVDANGCGKDSDGDGSPDGLDRCSETPRGATVDALGCPGDEDGDGVLDGLDRCPRTVTGAGVQANGCVPGQAPGQPAPGARNQPAPGRKTPGAVGKIVPGVIPGIAFAAGTARLSSSSYVALDSIAAILIADPTVSVEVAAHSDNSLSPAESMRLTGLQADAVRDYLVLKGVPYQQVSSKGYGSTVPLTPDTTPSGRAANRRVEIKFATPGP